MSIFNYNLNQKPQQFGLVPSDKNSFFFFFSKLDIPQRREIITGFLLWPFYISFCLAISSGRKKGVYFVLLSGSGAE